MSEPLPPGASFPRKAAYFLHLLEDDLPDKLSWTQIGLMFSTIFSVISGAAAMVQSVIGDLSHGEMAILAGVLGWHGVNHAAARFKQRSKDQ